MASTLASRIGAGLAPARVRAVRFIQAAPLAILSGAVSVFAMLTGTVMQARETRFPFWMLREKTRSISGFVHERVAMVIETAAA